MKKLTIAAALLSLSIATPVFACPSEHKSETRTAEKADKAKDADKAKEAQPAKEAKPAKDAKPAKPEKVTQR